MSLIISISFLYGLRRTTYVPPSAVRDDPIYRSQPDLTKSASLKSPTLNSYISSEQLTSPKDGNGNYIDNIGKSVHNETWTSRRYPYNKTMDELVEDLKDNEKRRANV